MGSRRQGRLAWAAGTAATGAAVLVSVAFATESTTRLAPNLDHPLGLAVSGNGQTVVTIDSRRHAVFAGDPSREEPWREVVAGGGDGQPVPRAVGCLPGDIVATVCEEANDWTIRTYRMKPDAVAQPAEPLQVVHLGTAAGEADDVGLAIHQTRGWLVVIGLPKPLPPVIRCAIAGVRLGPPSDRACPRVSDRHRPVAVAAGHAGDLVVVLRPDAGNDVIASYDATGRELLRLESGLRKVAAIGFGRGDPTLWATGASTDGQTGLWRLDAAFRAHRQVVHPVLVHPLKAPTAIVSSSERAIVVIEGERRPTIVRLEPPSAPPSVPGSSSP